MLGLAVLFVLYHNERFVFQHDSGTWKYFSPVRWKLLVHVLGGATALAVGALQFSTRLRQSYPAIHRALGYVYVGGVFIGAWMAAYLGVTHALYAVESTVQAGLWALTTLMALLAVRKRNLEVHREWAIRSYAVTLIFVFSRIVLALPFLARITEPGAERLLWTLTLCALLVPQIGLNWRHLFTRFPDNFSEELFLRQKTVKDDSNHRSIF